jgi:hypothetical protein
MGYYRRHASMLTNDQKLYTVVNAQGSALAAGCTVAEAATELLTYDGYDYLIRRADPEWDVAGEARWDLWHSDGSYASTRGARHMRCTRIGVYAPSVEAAWPLIAREVIRHADWFRNCDVMTDTDYASLQAEIQTEE